MFISKKSEKDNNLIKSMEEKHYFPTAPNDWFNYLIGNGMSNRLIQFIFHFDGQIDESRLAHAISRCIIEDPILKCRFNDSKENPCFEPINSLVPSLKFIKKGTDKIFSQCLCEPLETERDGQMVAILVRTESGDKLCFKFDHASSDGASAKNIIKRIVEIYNNPKKSLIGSIQNHRMNLKSLYQVSGDPIANEENFDASYAIPYSVAYGEQTRTICCSSVIGRELFMEASRRAKIDGATVNDLGITAFFRAYRTLLPKSELWMQAEMTIDLRRYLDDAQKHIRGNFSASEAVRLPNFSEMTFKETLNMVASETKKIKSRKPGSAMIEGCKYLENMGYKSAVSFVEGMRDINVNSGRATPIFTNVGPLFEFPINFGNATAVRAYVIPPAYHGPNFMLAFTTYEDMATFAVSIFEGERSVKDTSEFLELIKREIESYAASH